MTITFEKRKKRDKPLPRTVAEKLGVTLHHPESIISSLDKAQYDALHKYLDDVYVSARTFLSGSREPLAALVKEYNGEVQLSETQKMLDEEWKKGYPLAPPPCNLTVAKAHVEAAVAFMSQTITVDDGIWSANTDPTRIAQANAIADRLRLDAQSFSHMQELATAFRHGFICNLGGVFVEWSDNPVQALASDIDTGAVSPTLVPRAGNVLRPVDPFNVILDTRVAPHNMYRDGEFAGYITVMPRTKVFDRLRLGEWSLPECCADYDPYEPLRGSFSSDYMLPPDSRGDDIRGEDVIVLYARVFPALFGLSSETSPSVWKFTMLGASRTIVAAEPTDSIYLPVCLFEFDTETPYNINGSLVSQLIACQRFISFVFSGYQMTLLKNIAGGAKLVADSVVDISRISKAAMLGGVIQATIADPDKRLTDYVADLSAPVDLRNIPQDIDLALEMMQRIFPTDMLQQVANLERATQYQAAATVQAGNKRNVLVASSIDSQMMAPLRQLMVDNILRNVQSLEIVGEDGQRRVVPTTDFDLAELRFVVSDGLSGLDKLGAAESLQQAISNMLQMPQVLQGFDVYGAINYVLRLRGSNVDFNQFKLQAQAQPMPVQAPTPDMGAPVGMADGGLGIPGTDMLGGTAPASLPTDGALAAASPEEILANTFGTGAQ